MIRFLLAAIRALLTKGLQGISAAAHWMDGVFCGGSGGTVMPPSELALPEADELEVARYTAKSEATAKTAIQSLSPALQVFRYASVEEFDRYDADLSLLGPEQKQWLRSLSEDALRTVAAADLKRIDRALRGEQFVLKDINSVGQDSRPTDIAFAERLSVARASVPDERQNVRAL